MATSGQFLARTLSPIAMGAPVERGGYNTFNQTFEATPGEIYSDMEESIRLFPVILPRDEDNPDAKSYTNPLIVLGWPNRST